MSERFRVMHSSEYQRKEVSVGFHKNEHGDPLLVFDGVAIGTVTDVLELIADWMAANEADKFRRRFYDVFGLDVRKA